MENARKETRYHLTFATAIRLVGTMLAIGAGLLLFTVTQATPPAGIVSNVTLAEGATQSPLAESIAVGDSWALRLEDKGQSAFFFQDLVIAPQGRSGWHTHPGLLLITVKEGSVDWYDKDCNKRTFEAGQSFTESAEPHNVL